GLALAAAAEERSFWVDCQTLYDCIERVARARDLRVEGAAGGWECINEEHVLRLDERFALVADPEKLRFAGEPIIHIAEVGRPADERPRSQFRMIKLERDWIRRTPDSISVRMR